MVFIDPGALIPDGRRKKNSPVYTGHYLLQKYLLSYHPDESERDTGEILNNGRIGWAHERYYSVNS